MIVATILLVASAASLSDRDANAAVMFTQSVFTPPLFEICKEVQPELASEYDNVLAQWSKKNKRIVARGARVARAQAERDGTNLDAALQLETEGMVSELRGKPTSEQREHCERIVEVVRSET